MFGNQSRNLIEPDFIRRGLNPAAAEITLAARLPIGKIVDCGDGLAAVLVGMTAERLRLGDENALVLHVFLGLRGLALFALQHFLVDIGLFDALNEFLEHGWRESVLA